MQSTLPALRSFARATAITCACIIAQTATASLIAAQTAPPNPRTQQLLKLARAEFNGKNAYDVVAFMDNYFRVPGNTGFDASLDHVEGILKKAGYVLESGAPAGAKLTYRIEKRPLRTPAWDPIGASVTIAGANTEVLNWKTNRNMLAINSFSTPDSGILAPLVDAGKGTVAELDKADVKGKIVLVEGALGPTFTEAVVKRGAVGALAFRIPAYTQPDVHRNSIQFTGLPYDSVRKSWGMPISRNAFDILRAALAKGPVQLRVNVKTKFFESSNRTVVAEVHGTEKPDERFVFSAHVQEPGANDNASGVGALSEMARVLAKFSTSGSVTPKRTITMLFGNEIQQTRDFLADDSVRTRGVHWGVSLDMVGEDTKKTGGTFLIEKMPDPSAIWTRGEEKHTEWGGDVISKDRLVPHYFNDYLLARCLEQAVGTGWVVKTNPFEGGSDHTPFLQYKKPGVLFWHFTDVYYHTDGDRIDMVSPVTLTNVGISALTSALTLTTADGTTARLLIAELERAAVKRLDTELALSKTELAKGGDAAKERDILETWTDYYAKAVATMSDIEVGGSSPETQKLLTATATRIRDMGAAHVAKLIAK